MLRLGLTLAALVTLLDQATKWWAEAVLTPYRPLAVVPSLDLTLSYNSGAAFSFLAGQGGWQRWLFTALALAVSTYLVWWLTTLRAGERITAGGIGLILGGAIGNLVDRLAYGHVIDFIDVYYGSWHWPAFNIADSAITIGVALVLLAAVGGQRQ